MSYLAPAATISVVIPAHNAARVLPRALKSIEHQTVQAREIIVVDNLSTDDTRAVATSWVGSIPVRVITCDIPGSGAARNAGMRAATGNLIAFLDADDAWLPRKTEVQLTQYNDTSEFFSGTFMYYTTSAGKRIGNNARYDNLQEPACELKKAIAVPTPMSSIIIATSTALRTGPFNETFRRAQDFEWLSRVAQIAPLKVPTHEPMVDYFMEPDSSTANGYIEQGLAALEIKNAYKQARQPNYKRGVVDVLDAGNVPRTLRAGLAYRTAAIALGSGNYVAVITHLTRALLLAPRETINKIRWQIMRKPSGHRPPEKASF